MMSNNIPSDSIVEDSIPEWTKRDYIIYGYRSKKSINECIFSIFKIHNETINIWSHLISLITFLYILWYDVINYKKCNIANITYITNTANTANITDITNITDIANVNNAINILQIDNILYYNYIILLLYDLISITTFGISTIYHTFIPNDYDNYIILLKLDLLTIILVICSSNFIIMYYWFWCISNYLNMYIIASCIYLFGGIILLCFLDIIKKYNYILIYFSSYNLGIIIGYIYIIYNYKENVNKYIVYNFAGPLIIYMIGFIIYSAKIPEKVLYNYTDYIGNSHQIWHILSFIASYLFHEEIIKNIIYRNNNYLC